MTAPFYRAFEDRHRGSRELIIKRLEVYSPFLKPLSSSKERAVALDLGCGRGEWLEVLIGAGLDATGVDLDDGMLEACRTQGLPAVRGDAVGTLKERDSESLSVVSAFHLVEHIPFDILQQLVSESLRVLKPGGLLILETPNSENLFVGTSGFYMDPTHERPIPHLLLSFLTEFSGFQRSKLLRLQEQAHLHDPSFDVDLITALGSSSPDYAIVAQKAGDASVTAKFDAPFEQNYGITPGELAARYDQGIERRFGALRGRVEEVSSRADRYLEEFSVFANELAASKYQNGYLEHANEALLHHNRMLELECKRLNDEKSLLVSTQMDLESRLAHVEAGLAHVESSHHSASTLLNAVLSSTSWKITQPLRMLSSKLINRKPSLPGSSLKRRIAVSTVNFASTRPRLKRLGLIALKFFPASFKTRLWAISVASGTPSVAHQYMPGGVSSLSIRETEIYHELKSAFERKETK
jgi:O-antigen chain-terminating methyltransferase